MAGSARSLNSIRSGASGRTADYPRPSSGGFSPLGSVAASHPQASVPQKSLPSSQGGAYTLHSKTELEVGMRIEHAKFGAGTISNIDSSGPDARITVDFDTTDSRTLMLKFAKFAILG